MDIAQKTACGILDEMRAGALSAADLMAATYDQIETWNPSVNAIISLMPREEAVELARRADASSATGPLHGLPVAVKD